MSDQTPSSSQQHAALAGSSAQAATPPPPPPPVIPASQQPLPQQHWLDGYFPGVRQWLEDQNRKWWIKGLVQARCK